MLKWVNSSYVNLEKNKNSKNSHAYLWAAGQEGLNVDVGIMHFQIVVPKTSCDPNGRQHTGLQKMQHNLHLRQTRKLTSVRVLCNFIPHSSSKINLKKLLFL